MEYVTLSALADRLWGAQTQRSIEYFFDRVVDPAKMVRPYVATTA